MSNTLKVSENELQNYKKYYDSNAAYRLMKKLRKATKDKPGIISGPVKQIINILGHFLSAMENPSLPLNKKIQIMGAIGYIIFPADLIPDYLPGGYADDIASSLCVLASVKAYSNFSMDEFDKEL